MAEIGSTLREARMRARIDISEVEARTKIRAKYLRAIENEEWDLLPGTVYVKSFLRTYGDFLGLDSRLLLDEFKRRYEGPDDHELRSMASVARERERDHRPSRGARMARGSLSPKIVIAMALVVIVAALYVIGNNTGSGTSGTGSGAVAQSGHHHRKTTPGKNKPGKNKPGKKKHAKTATTPTTPTTTSTDATLALVPKAEVWVCVAEPSGKVLISQTYDAGETVPTESASEMLVTFGNANVAVTVDGKPYPLSQSAHVISLEITPTGAQAAAPAPACQ